MRDGATPGGFTLIELMIVIVIIAILAALAVPALLASQRGANEHSAAASIRTLLTAAADFKANDRDQNKINDYWTRDVAGFYNIYPISTPGSTIKLIDAFVAAADATPGGGTAFSTTNYAAQDISNYAPRAPKAGYWFFALDQDLTTSPPVPYRQVTETGGQAHHNISIFALGAYPEHPGLGKHLILVNEGGVIYRRGVIGNVRPVGTSPPPGYPLASGVVGGSASDPKDWPTEENLLRYYKKID